MDYNTVHFCHYSDQFEIIRASPLRGRIYISLNNGSFAFHWQIINLLSNYRNNNLDRDCEFNLAAFLRLFHRYFLWFSAVGEGTASNASYSVSQNERPFRRLEYLSHSSANRFWKARSLIRLGSSVLAYIAC